jgi:hypothetical protein
MARRNPPRKVTYFEPVAPRLARNTIIDRHPRELAHDKFQIAFDRSEVCACLICLSQC